MRLPKISLALQGRNEANRVQIQPRMTIGTLDFVEQHGYLADTQTHMTLYRGARHATVGNGGLTPYCSLQLAFSGEQHDGKRTRCF